jgi:DNA-binding NtrC family response regulator
VRVACGALRECEIEARLFGQPGCDWEEDASGRAGFWQSCRGGTLLLDDLTQLPLWVQVKLLDVLQDGLRGAGAGEPAPVDVRVIASVARDVDDALARNVLCAELYYYLNVVHVYVPPLRHRQQDIRALAEHFLAVAAAVCGHSPGAIATRRFSADAWQCLLNYDWPGNASQLASVVAHAVVLTEGAEIGRACVAEALSEARCQPLHSDAISVPLVGGLKRMERSIIDEVIQRCRGNKAAAARALGLHRRTLYRLLEEDHPAKAGETILSMTPESAAS